MNSKLMENARIKLNSKSMDNKKSQKSINPKLIEGKIK